MNIPDPAQPGSINARKLQQQGVSIDAHVASGSGVLKVDRLDARLGQGDINGFIELRQGHIPELEVDVYCDEIIVGPLLQEAGFDVDPESEIEGGRLIPDIPIPFEAMHPIDVSLDVDTGRLQRGVHDLNDTDIDLEARGANVVRRATACARGQRQ